MPTLARAILERNERMLNDTSRLIPLAGVAVGDPCTDNAAQKDSMDALWYANKHGLVAAEDFDFLWNTCGHRQTHAREAHMSRGRWHRDSNAPGGWRDAEKDEENGSKRYPSEFRNPRRVEKPIFDEKRSEGLASVDGGSGSSLPTASRRAGVWRGSTT